MNRAFSWFERVKVWLDLKFVQILVKFIPQLIQIARNHFRRTAKISNVKVKVFEVVQILLVGVSVKFEFVEFEMVQLIEIVGNCMRRAERNELNGKLVGCIWMHCCINMYRPSLSCKKYKKKSKKEELAFELTFSFVESIHHIHYCARNFGFVRNLHDYQVRNFWSRSWKSCWIPYRCWVWIC